MVGSASLCKRESYPAGVVRNGSVTATWPGVDRFTAKYLYASDPWQGLGGMVSHGGRNWSVQGADAGRYGNDDVHAIRILLIEPQTDPAVTAAGHRLWWSAGNERLSILGEIPVRKFQDGKQPIDPDGNPDTSFLATLPADVPWTFQTLDRDGLVLNMAQTWHQLRPGEVRYDCGGCHGHSQAPTPWEKTAAALPGYRPFDLTRRTPLVTTKAHDESGTRWDADDRTGLRFAARPVTVEYHRDIAPILARSCLPCHGGKSPAAELKLDGDDPLPVEGNGRFGREDGPTRLPGTYVRLVLDPAGKYGRKPPLDNSGYQQGTRYLRLFQSRRSLLVWKLFGRRLDGFANEDFAYETTPGDASTMQFHGEKVDAKTLVSNPGNPTPAGTPAITIPYLGDPMPPPAAVAGTWLDADGAKVQVQALSDEDRLTIARWIDLGCPIDVAGDAPGDKPRGWLADDLRPTLTIASPAAGENAVVDRIVVGACDCGSGLDERSFRVTADVPLVGVPPGENVAGRFVATTPGVWQLMLGKPLELEGSTTLTVSIADQAGNVARLVRTFSLPRRR
jgi:hypothetical protein